MQLSLVTLVALLSSAAVYAYPTTNEADEGHAALFNASSTWESGSDAYIQALIEAGLDIDDDSFNATVDAGVDVDKRAVKLTVSTTGTLPSTMLKYHNAWRAHHGAPALKWSTTLANAAKKSATKCVFAHTKNNKYGENIAAGTYNNPAYYAYL
ncbi:hypothetical protein ABW21_db0208519 [Orbilia brochopaga]|nr:hypothetical protein ABW21_db0208519 [Drechslerella brochopaga]